MTLSNERKRTSHLRLVGETHQISEVSRDGRALLEFCIVGTDHALTLLESDPDTPDLKVHLTRLHWAVQRLEDFRQRRQLEHIGTEKRPSLTFL